MTDVQGILDPPGLSLVNRYMDTFTRVRTRRLYCKDKMALNDMFKACVFRMNNRIFRVTWMGKVVIIDRHTKFPSFLPCTDLIQGLQYFKNRSNSCMEI